MQLLKHWYGATALLATAACGHAVADEAAELGPEWLLSPAPVVSLGVADGDPRYQLYNVAGALVLSDGRIVVLNGGHAAFSVYGSDGSYLAGGGRKGQGPGEFEAPIWMTRVEGDTVVVWDQRLKRLSYFSPDGAFARAVTVRDAEGMFPRPAGILRDGALLLDPGPDVFAMMNGEPGVRRDSVTLYRFGADGAAAGPLARHAGNEIHVGDRSGGFFWNDVPFGRRSYAVAKGEWLYIGDSGTGEIAVLSPAGERLRTLRSPHESWRVEPADAAAYREARLAMIQVAERRRESEATFDAVPTPGIAPVIGGLQVDSEGNVWVQAHPRPLEERVTWSVLSSGGQPLGRVQVPAELTVLDVGRDYLLGVRRDELGVERVDLYTFERSGS